MLRTVSATIIGLGFGSAAFFMLQPIITAFFPDFSSPFWSPLAVTVAGGIAGFLAPSLRSAIVGGVMVLGAAALTLPLSIMIPSTEAYKASGAPTPGEIPVTSWTDGPILTSIGYALAAVVVLAVVGKMWRYFAD